MEEAANSTGRDRLKSPRICPLATHAKPEWRLNQPLSATKVSCGPVRSNTEFHNTPVVDIGKFGGGAGPYSRVPLGGGVGRQVASSLSGDLP
jgi:hypothetical protein